MVKIIKTDSYFNIFPILANRLKEKKIDLDKLNLVFSEEKVSLMAERWITSELNGCLNTEVYSFGSFLLKNKSFDNLLSREGSAMVIKKILSEVSLTCFSRSKATMAGALYDLLILLKSASVTPEDVYQASLKADGVLKNKLTDIYTVYKAYQNYLKERNLEDQSGQLDYLPEVIENHKGIENADVYVIGYNGFTAQIKKAISLLMKKARSLTAILPSGKNNFVFVNETVEVVKNLAKQNGIEFKEEFIPSNRPIEAEFIKDTLFSAEYIKAKQIETEKIFSYTAKNQTEEFEKIASVIESKVRSENYKYKNFSVILPDLAKKDGLIKAFNLLKVPYFIDEKVSVMNHPLVTLLLSYVEIFRKNFSRKDYLSFVKNPIICDDKKLTDRFENYLLRYDLDYSALKNPFQIEDEETLEMEEFRKKISEYLKNFSPLAFLDKINIEKRLEALGEKLKQTSRSEEVSINEQVLGYVNKILSEINLILGEQKVTLFEFKNLLISGLTAVKLSIIPQYNDAVFVGGFKEVGLYQTDYVFLPLLTSAVPTFKEDVAILSDNDLSLLSGFNVIVEPKIKVANHRLREETAMGLSCFKKGLFLSYSISSESGAQNRRSQLFSVLERSFTIKPFMETERYLTRAQGLRNYSKEISGFVHEGLTDIEEATAWRQALNDKITDDIANASKKQLKVRLENGNTQIDSVAPTTLESYYSCPYRTFVEKTLRVKERKEGKLDAPAFGTIVHEIFFEFLRVIDEVTDDNFNLIFNKIAQSVSQKKIYACLQGEGEKEVLFNSLITETKKFCKKNYEWAKNGKFKTQKEHLEVNFGVDNPPKDFKNITLNDRVRLKGVIDRVDVFGDYARVIDYKTGKTNGSAKALFSGEKLQLYLYALALKDKKLSGAYYMPISDEYCSIDDKEQSLVIGNTLEDQEILSASDKNFAENNKSEYLPVHLSKQKLTNTLSPEQMNALVEYAKQMGERAISQMEDGVIAPSPIKDFCNNCKFSAVCGVEEGRIRQIKKVTEETVSKAILGENDG